jgi:hypothetical protein
MAHIEEEHATPAIPTHAVAKLADWETRFLTDREFSFKLIDTTTLRHIISL